MLFEVDHFSVKLGLGCDNSMSNSMSLKIKPLIFLRITGTRFWAL